MATSIGSIEGRLTLRDQFTGAMKRATSQLQQSGEKMERVGRRMSEVGSTLTRSVTLPLVAIGGAAVKSFADFDDAMNQSLAIMGNVSKTLRDDMAGAARTVAKETVFSAEQAAESYFFLASAGLDAAQSIEAMPQVAAFAQAGMFDMARATDLLTDAQSALGLTVQDTAENTRNMARVSDVLVKANTLANASVEQFSTALTSKAGAALKSFDIAMEEGVAVLAAFADQGVKAELAGNSLDRILRLLPSAAIKNADAYREMGIQVFDSSGELRNMADILGDLETALGGMGDEQKQAALEALGFQARVQGIIKPLLGTSDAIREYEEELRNAAGTTQEVADKQLESFKKQMGLVRDQLVDAAVTLGSELAPIIQDFAEGTLVPAIEKLAGLAEGFGNLERSTQGIIVAVGAAVAAFGPLLFVTGQLITAWGALATAAPGVARAITSAFNPVTALIGGIASLGIVANEAINKWRESSEQGIAAIIAANDRAKESVKQVREELETGVVSGSTFEELANESFGLEKAIERTEEKIADLKGQMSKTSLGDMQDLRDEIEEQEEKLSNLRSEYVVVQKALKDVGDATVEWKDKTEEANEAAEGLGGTTGELGDALKEALEGLEMQTEVNRALADALAESQAAYDKLNVLLDAGVPLAEALSGEYDALAAELIESREAVDELQESLEGLAEATAAGGPMGSLFDFAREMKRAAEIVDEASASGGSSPVGIGPVPGMMLESMQRAMRVFGSTADSVLGTVKEIRREEERRQAALDEINELLEEGKITQEEAAKAIEKMGVETGDAVRVNWEQVWSDVAATAISEMLNALSAILDGTKSTSQAMGDLLVAAFTAAGTAIAGPIGGAIGSLFGGILAESFGLNEERDKVAGVVGLGGEETFGNTLTAARRMNDLMLEITNEIEELGRQFGFTVTGLQDIRVVIQESGRAAVEINGSVRAVFDNVQDAQQFAAQLAVAFADVAGGVGEFVQMLQAAANQAENADEFNRAVGALREIMEVELGETGTAVFDAIQNFHDLADALQDVGLSGAAAGKVLARDLKAIRADITGVSLSARQLFEMRRLEFNREIAREKQRQQAALASAEADMAAAEAEIARITSSTAFTEAQLTAFEIEQAITDQLTDEMRERLNAARELLFASKQAAETARTALDNLPDPISPDEFRAPDTGPSDAERLAEAMEKIERSMLPSLARQMAELRLKYEELINMAGKDEEALARLLELRRQEAELIRQQATEELFGQGIVPFERVGESALRGGIRDVMEQGDQLRKQAEEWAAAMAESAEESGKFFDEAKRLSDALDRIAAAERRRIEAIVGDEAEDLLMSALNFLGRTEQAERLSFQLSQAEFKIRLQELKIAAKKHDIEVAALQEISNLVGEITDLSFEDFQELQRAPSGGGGGPDPRDERDDAMQRLLDIMARSLSPFEQAIRRTVDEFAELRRTLGFTQEVQDAYAKEIQRVLREQLEPIRRLQEELNFRADAPMRTIDQFKLAQKNLNDALAALRGGDLSQVDKIPDLARRILDLNPAAQGSEGNRFIFELVNRALEEAQEAAEEAATGIEPGGPNDPFAWLRHTPTAGDSAVSQSVRTMANRVVSSQDETTDAIKDNTEETKKRPKPQGKVVDISGFRPAVMENLARRQNHILENVRGDLGDIKRNQRAALPK